MKKRLIISILLVANLLIGYTQLEPRFSNVLAQGESLYTRIKILTSILETVQRAYLEERTTEELINDAINGMLSNLDPHTSYLTSDEFKKWNESFEGYSGIGITYDIINDKITVLNVDEGGPAERAGLQAGDRIVEINGQSALGLKRDTAATRLKGKSSTRVLVKVERDGWTRPRTLHITRERILMNSLTQALMFTPSIGYIKIQRFTATTSMELERELDELQRQSMQKLVLDLRGNSGGYLNAAVEVADKFIPGGQRIVYTKGRLASSYQEFYSTSEPTHPLFPLAVLIDHGSASASEIVAGAIQDLDRGLIVGQTSFGKGLVQSQYRFHDGSALLLTTARYYTPSGRPIQRDYYNKSKDEYYGEAYDDRLRNEDAYVHSQEFRTRSGRPIQSGNGIRPDVVVENNENRLARVVRQLFFDDQRHFYTYARSYIRRYPGIRRSRDYFVEGFEISTRTFEDFVGFVKHVDPEFAEVDFTPHQEMIKFILKRELAYLLWGEEARFRVNCQRDHQLQEAVRQFAEAARLLTRAGWVAAGHSAH